jgi:asparagine synthase (glutamine-hydrolysing)
MCGICGIVSVRPGYMPDRALIERMRDTITHRGPDGAGTHVGPGVGLGVELSQRACGKRTCTTHYFP